MDSLDWFEARSIQNFLRCALQRVHAHALTTIHEQAPPPTATVEKVDDPRFKWKAKERAQDDRACHYRQKYTTFESEVETAFTLDLHKQRSQRVQIRATRRRERACLREGSDEE